MSDEENKPKYRSLRFDQEEEEHKIQYRSMAAAIAAPMDPFTRTMAGAGAGRVKSGPMMRTPGGKSQATTTTTALVDSTNYSTASPKSLPIAPFRLEPQTHFFVNGSVQRICSILGRTLAESGSDFIFRDSKCKWKTDYYDNAQRTHLNIVMFKTDEKQHVIELQRREGDMIAFMGLYRLLYQTCMRHQLITNPKSPPSSFKSKPATKSVQPKDMLMVMAPICAMLESKYYDIQYQGILAIISLSSEELCRKALSVTIPQLLKLSRNEKFQRISLAALSKLSSDTDCRRRIMETQDWSSLLSFVTAESAAMELKRTSMEVLADLCLDYSSELAQASNQNVISLLNNCETIPDVRMKQSAMRARSVLQTHGLIN